MEKKQIKINGKIAVEIKINGGLFWKAGGPEPSGPNKLVYSANAAGSTITVNGEAVTLEQGENIVLDYPSEIISVKATKNTALTAIQIPNTVTEIEGNTATSFLKNNSAFYNCTSLVSVTLPDTIKFIGKQAFRSCTSLKSINIPNSVTSIDKQTFTGCTSLTSINIPNSVTSIGNSAFSSTALVSINIPESVKSIGEGAFNNCESLRNVTLPEGIKSLGASTFYRCTSLASVTLPESLTSIGESVFADCTSLVSINIPNSVTSIGIHAFYNCSKLTDFNFNGTMSQWASITKGNEWNLNSAFLVVHCTDGDVNIL